jgi:hypothetical protein
MVFSSEMAGILLIAGGWRVSFIDIVYLDLEDER